MCIFMMEKETEIKREILKDLIDNDLMEIEF